jgi:hypothetical protein
MKVKFGAGKWDSWGFGISYCHYDRSISINLIHWFFYVEMWTAREDRLYVDNMAKYKNLLDAYDNHER